MSKQSKNTETLVNQVVTKVKQNYRFAGLTSKSAIIAESDKQISSSIRSGIVQLLCNSLTDTNIDMISIICSCVNTDKSSPIADFKYKYTCTREGDFVNCNFASFLCDTERLINLQEVTFVLCKTNVDTFQVSVDKILVQIPAFFDDICLSASFVLNYIYHRLVNEL